MVPSGIVIGVGGATVAVGAWPIIHDPAENLLECRMTMELSMASAAAKALAIGELFVALVIAAFVLGAEVLSRAS